MYIITAQLTTFAGAESGSLQSIRFEFGRITDAQNTDSESSRFINSSTLLLSFNLIISNF